jgi:hypothetical protein
MAPTWQPGLWADGVPDEVDFAPAINNYHIYAGVGILLAGLVITLRTSSKRKKKLGLERQRKEAERRREQERKKKMKQEILDMIEEVTSGEK